MGETFLITLLFRLQENKDSLSVLFSKDQRSGASVHTPDGIFIPSVTFEDAPKGRCPERFQPTARLH
jgi:hypothetical protein